MQLKSCEYGGYPVRSPVLIALPYFMRIRQASVRNLCSPPWAVTSVCRWSGEGVIVVEIGNIDTFGCPNSRIASRCRSTVAIVPDRRDTTVLIEQGLTPVHINRRR